MNNKPAVTELRLVVTAPDYEQALHFYRDVLGLPEHAAYTSPGGRVTILEAGRATPPPPPPSWLRPEPPSSRGARRAVGAGLYPDVVHEAGAGEIRPEDRYDDLVEELAGIAGVTPPLGTGGFGRTAVRFQNKIFVMLVRGQLVLKLPAERADALVAAGDGVRFDANKGTPMKEWLSLAPESGEPWLLLAREALSFARSGR